MRGAVDGLPPPAVSLAAGLPPSFFGSGLTTDLVEAFDEVLAPIVATLDDLDAYFDPRYAPDDCMAWFGSWLSTLVDARWSAERIRRHLPDLAEALVGRGTVRGLAAGVRACTGTEPTVRDNGGVAWNSRPNGALPGRATPLLEVDVTLAGAQDAPIRSLVHAVVADLKPAHVPSQVRLSSAD